MNQEMAQIEPTASVAPSARLGWGVKIWHHVHVMADARIGDGSMLGHACFVGAKVEIGARCRIQNHVSLFEGIVLEDEVFVGPSAVFTNVKTPRAFVSRREQFGITRVGRGATIGANATILPGLQIGRYAFVAAGAVVTRNVPDFCLVRGCPAEPAGWLSRSGQRLGFDANGLATCGETGEHYALEGDQVSLLPRA